MGREKASRFLAEFVVIVVGVLVALGVDEWREDRTERVAETRYVERLITDLVSDSTVNARMIRIGARKSAALSAAIEALWSAEAVHRNPNLAWPDMGRTYGRTSVQTTTFDELQSSGGLSLIQQDDLRFRIGDHYGEVLHHDERLDERRTRLAEMVAELFPAIAWGGSTQIEMSPAEIDSAFFAAPYVEHRLQQLVGPEYLALLNQERIYARSMEDISSSMLDLTTGLLAELRTYRASLE